MRDCFAFGAVRGIQAGRVVFVAICPLRQIPRSFLFAEEELPPELRAQRNFRPLKQAPHLGSETISVVPQSLSRCQQMFADLNRHATRPTSSLSIPYDHRDFLAQSQEATF